MRVAILGLGAAWDADEHRRYGFEFPAPGARVDRLEVAGRTESGRVERIVDFGAFINILPGKDGLVHISQIADERVEKVTDYLKEGQEVDVVVLDVEMPRMNGIEFLERLMRLRPMPVVMVSTLTERGAEVTMKALELGALDFVAKPRLGVADGMRQLADDITDKTIEWVLFDLILGWKR